MVTLCWHFLGCDSGVAGFENRGWLPIRITEPISVQAASSDEGFIRTQITQEVTELLSKGVIIETADKYISQIFLVEKKQIQYLPLAVAIVHVYTLGILAIIVTRYVLRNI